MVTDNGTQAITLPKLTCISSDTAVITVNNTGLITEVANGAASITTTITDYPEVSITIPVEVSGAVTPSYNIVITSSSTTITIGGSARTLTATLYENGTPIATQLVLWSIKNQDGTSTTKATITTFTDSTCKVQSPDIAENLGFSIIVSAALKSDSSIVGELTLLLTSGF